MRVAFEQETLDLIDAAEESCTESIDLHDAGQHDEALHRLLATIYVLASSLLAKSAYRVRADELN